MEQYQTNPAYINTEEVKARVAQMSKRTGELIAWSDEVGRESLRISEELRGYFANRK